MMTGLISLDTIVMKSELLTWDETMGKLSAPGTVFFTIRLQK